MLFLIRISKTQFRLKFPRIIPRSVCPDLNFSLFSLFYTIGHGGYRVASNALPVGPSAPAVHHAVGPAPVQDTPEVVQARAAHFAAHAAVRAGRQKRGLVYSAAHPAVYSAAHPVAYTAGHSVAYTAGHPTVYSAGHHLGYSAGHPLVYNAAAFPATRAATLTRVVNTPGHAVSYRVD